ncbi:hypothetical protein [Gymnodinialimonas hymeniacidonis]|uniref:hypothetical protein n=1 Tax=Gymnodinialimonas hymeniacidonis TaxID=3126508 RepID=UPI0034C68708
MLDGLDDISWDSLVHAYGPASDVPADLRALLSADENTAKDALWRLFGNIHHQGTVYLAAPPAIPFLTEIALALPPERAAGVVDLLSAMLDYAADMIIEDGLTVAAFREKMRADEAALDPKALAECREFGCYPTVIVETYDAVMAQIPVLMEGLDTDDPTIQIALFGLLADAPEHSAMAKTLAERVLFFGTSDEVAQVSAIECLRRLSLFDEVADFGPIIERLTADGASPFLTAYVVLAQSKTGQAGKEDLLRVLQKADRLYEIDRMNARGEGWTAPRIAGALMPWADTDKERICDAIMGAISAARTVKASPDDVIAVLVRVLASPQPAQDYFTGKRTSDLTPLERRALLHVAEFGTWKLRDKWFANFAQQMRSYGLPDKPDALERFAGAKRGVIARLLGR